MTQDRRYRALTVLRNGTAIPASPLALTPARELDERRQRALWRYYSAAGVGGIAVGVHTTQFAIRDPAVGLFRPLLELAAEELGRLESLRGTPLVRVGGICGDTPQAIDEAVALSRAGFDVGLLSLAALRQADLERVLEHCRQVARLIPVMGFYLQPAVGGRPLPYAFWREFVDIEGVVAIKIAPFDRYATLDVVRAVVESGRDDVALYTGNDDAIVHDLLTPFRFRVDGEFRQRHIVGGLLGHWAVWTRPAVELFRYCRVVARSGDNVPVGLLELAPQVTDANAAFFDAANAFGGCIAGLHEVLRRQGLLDGIRCLDPAEGLGPGQREEIERVYAAYPHLNDDEFVHTHRDRWLAG